VTVANRQAIIRDRVTRLCTLIEEYDGSKTSMNLGTAISAFTGDIATKYIIGKSYDNLETQDFGANMTNLFQSSGAVWRITKHVRWLGPAMKAIPLPIMEKVGDDGTRAFLAFLKVWKY
jgi:hypothetical protein